jgi:hypothetical protein
MKKEFGTMAAAPTYEQAQLHLQIYDLRREARMREARDWYFKNFHPQTPEDGMRLAGPGTEGGKFTMMVLSYWEQACSLLNHGLLHEDLFFENSGEFFGVWESVKPIISQWRGMFVNPLFLANLEKAAVRFEEWSEKRTPGHLNAMRQFMKQMTEQQKQGKAA